MAQGFASDIPPAVNGTAKKYIRGMMKGKNRWNKLYGSRSKEVMHKTANKMAMGEMSKMPPTYTDVFGEAKMIKGSGDTSQLGGPIRIAKITGQVAEIGVLPFISIMAYISISLGLINLFPIPMLDGGHLMFYAFEKVLGRPLSQKVQEGFFRIGMFLLISLMFFTTFNDLKDLGLFK